MHNRSLRHSSLAARMPAEAIPHAPVSWGLSSRLPRCHMFDGRQSRLTPHWAIHDEKPADTSRARSDAGSKDPAYSIAP